MPASSDFSFAVREATPADRDALFLLLDALADYEQLPPPDAPAKARLFHDGFVRTPPRFSVYLVVEGDNTDRAVGYAIALETYSSFLARPTLYIEDLFVVPEARGKGAGRTLFHFLAAEALRRGCARLEWVCLEWNKLAIAFYEKHGGQHLSDWRYYRLTDDQMKELTENHYESIPEPGPGRGAGRHPAEPG